jgi:maltose alpha-D-glucosyltransferase/alpha-amylase
MIDRNDLQWYRDAIIYQLHVKSFFDSSNDGVGDFAGLTEKLDYIKDLGATAIWVMPFYPSPQRDDGYDISYYRGINPAYGGLRDFKRFLREAHERGLRVITELVINHTSDQHPWFKRARAAKPGQARTRPIRKRLSFSATLKSQTGPGMIKPKHFIGIAFSRISPI